MPRTCPRLYGRDQIEPGFFASPVPLPLTRTLSSCWGLFDDPHRDGWSGITPPPWGAEDFVVGHNGIDAGAVAGAWATAAADGDVVRAQATAVDDAGVWCAVRHICPNVPEHRFVTRELHFEEGSLQVKVGDKVVKGQRLGKVGTTGSAKWRHTHFDLRHAVDPASQSVFNFGPKWGVPYDPVVFGILQSPPPAPPSPLVTVQVTVDRPVLKGGVAGRPVEELQFLLHIAATGSFDAATVAGVKSFQMSRNLTADGIVGKDTWTALLDY